MSCLCAYGAVAQKGLETQIDQVDSHARIAALEPLKRANLIETLRSRDYAAAETLVASEARAHPKSQQLLLLLGEVLFLDGKQLNSILVFKKAEMLGPLDEQSRYLLALSYVSIGRRNLAIPEFEKLADAQPLNARYPYWLARIMYGKMDLARSLPFALQAVRLDPSFGKAYDQLGLCYAGLGEDENAIQSYKTAVRLGQAQSLHWPWPALNLGTLYLRLNRLDEAEESLSECLRIEPNFPIAHFRLGQVFEKKGQPDKALEELRKSVTLDPTYPEPHYALARIYRRQNNTNAAEQESQIFKRLRATDIRKGIRRSD